MCDDNRALCRERMIKTSDDLDSDIRFTKVTTKKGAVLAFCTFCKSKRNRCFETSLTQYQGGQRPALSPERDQTE